MKIHELLKARRQQLGISQDALANHVGFRHRSNIHRLESGKLEWKFKDVVKACTLLNLEIEIKENNDTATTGFIGYN
ncbi:MAG: helix-turn-helix domain-containing protein [Candidatus Hodarchaeales archaeon]|jgi:predicted transcriptional regulator